MIERHADSFVVASLVVLLIFGRPSGILARLDTDPLIMIHLRLIFEFSCRRRRRRRSRSLRRRTSFRLRLRERNSRLTQPNTTRNGALWRFFVLLLSPPPPLSFDGQAPLPPPLSLSLSAHPRIMKERDWFLDHWTYGAAAAAKEPARNYVLSPHHQNCMQNPGRSGQPIAGSECGTSRP